jgi:hypothetical protein
LRSLISPSGKYIVIGLKRLNSFFTEFDIETKSVYYSDDYGVTFTTYGPICNIGTNTGLFYSLLITDNGYIFGMNSVDKIIYRFNFDQFKASTFTSLAITNTLTAATFSSSSDYRIKTDVSQLDEIVTIDNLRPVKYLQTLLNKPQYGLIAHELQEYYPDLVIGEKDGDEMQRINYTGLISILIHEIKQLKQELIELENEVQ